jgi:tRNA-dihydrouridine synthase
VMAKRTLSERIDKCIELLTLSVERKGEKRAVIEMRKFYIGYLKGEPNAAKLRNFLMQFYEAAPIIDILQSVKEKGIIEEERFQLKQETE